MNDMPPKVEKIVLIHKYNVASQASVRQTLWYEMEKQMEMSGDTLDEFLNKAIEMYLKSLKKEREDSDNYLAFNEYQLFPTQPIQIRPNPGWYYNLEEEKK